MIGGVDPVSDPVADQVALFLTDAHPVARLSGADRCSTAAVVARTTFPDVEVAVLATDRTFPDALAAVAAAAAVDGAPWLLGPGDCTPAATDEHLSGAAYLGGTIVVGDGSAISDESFARTC